MPPAFNPLDYPLLIVAFVLPAFWIAARMGAAFRKKRGNVTPENEDDFSLLLGAVLTLLGLIIGFTFSMAVSRYDQRKNLEEEEANAIGTEYVRADLLNDTDSAKVHALLRDYLDHRLRYYNSAHEFERHQISAETSELQDKMWLAVSRPVKSQETSTAISALILSGMNDVLNSQGYTQAAWWNRIPFAAWLFLIAISVLCNFLIGYRVHGSGSATLLLILPVALAISLFLIADIDSPRRGVIRVHPQNLESLAQSLRSR
jgi:hypothetical protein